MKKLFYSVAVIVLAIIIPLTSNAATITARTPAGNSEAAVREVVEITVELDEKEVESMQFDLAYDQTRFAYVQESAKSELNSTLSHVIEPGVVRVSVLDNDTNTKTANKVTMQFTAIAGGEKCEFKLVDGSVEVGKSTGVEKEIAKTPTITIDKVVDFVPSGSGEQPAFTTVGGAPITALPNTGEDTETKAVKSIDGVYENLGNLNNVVLYALPTSDSTLSLADVKAEFGNNITTNISGNVKTGDTFQMAGVNYTIIIYGDVNCDGKVSTYDALVAKKIKLGLMSNVTEFAREAANIEKSVINTIEMQKFILRLRATATDTILDQFPAKLASTKKVESIQVTPRTTAGYAGDEIVVATIVSTTPEAILTGTLLATEVTKDGNPVSGIISYSPTANAGEYNIVLKVNETGTYKVFPKINVAGTEIVDANNAEISVQVNKDTDVAEIKVYNGTTEVLDSVDLISGSNLDLSIKYYNINGIEITEDDREIKSNELSLSITDASSVLGSTYLFTVNDEVVQNGQGGNNHIDTLVVQSQGNSNGDATLSLNINGNTIKTITVKVQTPQVTGIKIGDKSYTDGESMNIDMYTYDPSNSNVKVEGGIIYTIIDFKLLNQFYDPSNPDLESGMLTIKGASVDKESVLNKKVVENGIALVEVNGTRQANVQFIKLNSSRNIAGSTENVTAIGVAFVAPGDTTRTQKVVDNGIAIYFDYNCDGSSATYKTLHLNVTRQDAPVTTSDEPEVTAEQATEAPAMVTMAKAPAKLDKDNNENTNTNTNTNTNVVTNTNTNTNTNVNTNTNTNTNVSTNTATNTTVNNTTGNNTVADNTTTCKHENCKEEITKYATCIEAGEKTVTCKDCGNVEIITLEPIGHEYGEDGKCIRYGCDSVKEESEKTEVSENEVDVNNIEQ